MLIREDGDCRRFLHRRLVRALYLVDFLKQEGEPL